KAAVPQCRRSIPSSPVAEPSCPLTGPPHLRLLGGGSGPLQLVGSALAGGGLAALVAGALLTARPPAAPWLRPSGRRPCRPCGRLPSSGAVAPPWLELERLADDEFFLF